MNEERRWEDWWPKRRSLWTILPDGKKRSSGRWCGLLILASDVSSVSDDDHNQSFRNVRAQSCYLGCFTLLSFKNSLVWLSFHSISIFNNSLPISVFSSSDERVKWPLFVPGPNDSPRLIRHYFGWFGNCRGGETWGVGEQKLFLILNFLLTAVKSMGNL